MLIPLKIIFCDSPASGVITEEVRKHARILDQFADHILHCLVVIDTVGSHPQRGLLWDVRLEVTLKGQELAVERGHHHEDIGVVLDDAFETALRLVADYVQCRQREAK